jgi:hypothetical protein
MEEMGPKRLPALCHGAYKYTLDDSRYHTLSFLGCTKLRGRCKTMAAGIQTRGLSAIGGLQETSRRLRRPFDVAERADVDMQTNLGASEGLNGFLNSLVLRCLQVLRWRGCVSLRLSPIGLPAIYPAILCFTTLCLPSPCPLSTTVRS